MCDSLCALTSEGTIFAKNSDRPADELQLPVVHGARPGGGRLRTQYLEMDDAGAAAVLLSRPDWLWGAEHGLSEHGVAVGNERVDTAGGADRSPAALIGMDLVRLGLERARSAEGAVDAIVALLERHGQGGLCDRTFDQAYDSSFLVADGTSAWVLETAGRDWAAQPVPAKGVAAISNRLTIRRDWTRASAAVKAGGDFDAWRDPGVDSAYADGRLAASRDFLGCGDGPSGVPHQPMTARRMVSHLRDHGTGPWGEPGRPLLPGRNGVAPPPPAIRATGRDISVCMHVGGIMATTASMVAWLPDATGRPIRSWLALGSPCVSLYVPLLGLPADLPGPVGATLWRHNAELRRRVEAEGQRLASIRAVIDPLEAELWDEADGLLERPDQWARFHSDAWRRTVGVAAQLVGVP